MVESTENSSVQHYGDGPFNINYGNVSDINLEITKQYMLNYLFKKKGPKLNKLK